MDTESTSSNKADNSQTQTTDTQDNRIVTAANSVGLVVSRSNGNVNVSTTDQGTVAKAFDFANALAKGAASNMADTSATIKAVTTSSLDAVKNAYANESKTLADAYTTAKAGEQKVLVAGTVGLLALVAIRMMRKL